MTVIQVIGDDINKTGNRRYMMDDWEWTDDSTGTVYNFGKPTIDKMESVPCMVCVTISNEYGGKIMDSEVASEIRSINESYDHTLHDECIVRANIKRSHQVDLSDIG